VVLIKVSTNAAAAHLAHGDSQVGDVLSSGLLIGNTEVDDTFVELPEFTFHLGPVDLAFEARQETFVAADCSVRTRVVGRAVWVRQGDFANNWSGPITDLEFAGDGTNASFTVSVDTSTLGVAPIGCDITFDVSEGEVGVGTWNIVSVSDTGPGDTCAFDGQIQGPFTIDDGKISVEDPA
jgi:hypothetical protein